MPAKTLEDLFGDGVKDIYYAERKIIAALKKMIRGAQAPDLKAAFDKHLQETEVQLERLVQVFELLGKPARGKTCPAIDGIIEEGRKSLRNSRALRHSTRVSWPRRKLSNILGHAAGQE
jgi:ferritin-like metal-binding protein YciE